MVEHREKFIELETKSHNHVDVTLLGAMDSKFKKVSRLFKDIIHVDREIEYVSCKDYMLNMSSEVVDFWYYQRRGAVISMFSGVDCDDGCGMMTGAGMAAPGGTPIPGALTLIAEPAGVLCLGLVMRS